MGFTLENTESAGDSGNSSNKKAFQVPYGYFIDILGSPGGGDRYDHNDAAAYRSAETIIAVYRCLGFSRNNPVQHTILIGSFIVSELENKTVKQFFKEVREGIEKLIDLPQNKLPNPY